jgi:hypothetical protein
MSTKATIRLRIIKACYVCGTLVEVGETVTCTALDAAGLLAGAKAVALDPEAANAALIAANDEALRIEKAGQAAPAAPSWVRRVA